VAFHSQTDYPSDLGINWLSNLDSYINTDDTDLDIPNVDITKMNRDQTFAFQIAIIFALLLVGQST
jgi:hypothetical protein